MPRKFDPHRIPPLLLHKSTGQARARFGGKYVYLGKHGSPEAARRYGELLQQQFQGVGVVPVAEAPSNGSEVISVNELCLRFVTERLPQYVTSSGWPSAEQDCFKGVIRHLRKIFGETAVVEFCPLKLRIVREAMIAADWSRNFVNKQVGRLRYLFRWASRGNWCRFRWLMP